MLKISMPPQQWMNFKLTYVSKKTFYFWHDNPSSKTVSKKKTHSTSPRCLSSFFLRVATGKRTFISMLEDCALRLSSKTTCVMWKSSRRSSSGASISCRTQEKIKQQSIKVNRNARKNQVIKNYLVHNCFSWTPKQQSHVRRTSFRSTQFLAHAFPHTRFDPPGEQAGCMRLVSRQPEPGQI